MQRLVFGGLWLKVFVLADSKTEKTMADQEMEDAMIIIQEASAKIAKVSEKLSGLETNSQEVVAALKDLSNKVANLEKGRLPNGEKSQTNKAPLYIRVSDS